MASFYTEISHLQDLVTNIYNNENQRVQNKKQGINDMISSQKRMIALNQSYTSKMKKYGFMIGIIAFALVFVVMIITFYSLIPSIIADLSLIIVIAGSLIWCYLIYMDIQKRDSIDFNELSSDSSALLNTANIDKSNNLAGMEGDISTLENNLISQAGCIGKQCCPTDWSNNSATLLPGSIYYNTNTKTCKVQPTPVPNTQPVE